jgi:CarboxypepD_reg-like domain
VRNKITLLFIVLFYSQISLGQTVFEKKINGQIVADSTTVERINILNSSNDKSTVSDQKGFFVFNAKEGDVLVFSAVHLETIHKKISKEDLLLEILKIKMVPKSIALKEVVVNEHPEITAESLGIIPYGQKKYTPAERKLYTATSGNGIDGLLNTISGRKAMLKKEIVIEKKEQLLVRIENLFEDKYYTDALKIPLDYIKGFQYYAIEDASFAAALRSKNKTMVMFLIVKLAEKYNQIITNEN